MIIRDHYKIITRSFVIIERLLQDYYKIITGLFGIITRFSMINHDYYKIIHDY